MLEGDGFDVVGEASDGAEALAEASRHRPKVIVLDIGLPDGSGLDLVESLRALSPGVVIVLVSGRRESDFGGRVAASGADRFLEKARLVPGAIPLVLADMASS